MMKIASRPRIHDQGLPPSPMQLLPQGADEDVGSAAAAHIGDHADRPRRVALAEAIMRPRGGGEQPGYKAGHTSLAPPFLHLFGTFQGVASFAMEHSRQREKKFGQGSLK
jgi:hypothetical protein